MASSFLHPAFLLFGILPASAATFPLTGVEVSELNGDGYAFFIPNLDGLSVNPDGSVNYNPLSYEPKAPFDLGELSYDSDAVGGQGVEFVPVDAEMFAFDFSPYTQDFIEELAVIGDGDMRVVMSNIEGSGLKFVDGTLTGIDFTAEVALTPLLKGVGGTGFFPQTFAPYTGRLTFTGNRFQWEVDSRANWIIGATHVRFVFDLGGTLDGLPDAEDPRAAFAAWIGQFTLDPTMRTPGASPTADGIPNLLKYALGLSPAEKARLSEVFVLMPAQGGGWRLNFATAHSAAGVEVYLESSDTLVEDDWQRGAVTVDGGPDEDGFQSWHAYLPPPPGGGARFYRLAAGFLVAE
jgi:hypothetical protein